MAGEAPVQFLSWLVPRQGSETDQTWKWHWLGTKHCRIKSTPPFFWHLKELQGRLIRKKAFRQMWSELMVSFWEHAKCTREEWDTVELFAIYPPTLSHRHAVGERVGGILHHWALIHLSLQHVLLQCTYSRCNAGKQTFLSCCGSWWIMKPFDRGSKYFITIKKVQNFPSQTSVPTRLINSPFVLAPGRLNAAAL